MLIEITKAYTESRRKYHTLDHIAYMINRAVEWKWELTDELLYAIWYHDVVYLPFEKDNEQKSAELFKQHYDKFIYPLREDIDKECGYGDELAAMHGIETPWHEQDVIYAILSTKNHRPLNELAKKLIDLDLAILAEPFDACDKYEHYNMKADKWFNEGYNLDFEYDKYLFHTRQEYDPDLKHDDLWNEGRSRWIKSMLSREKLFYTIKGANLEKQARENLKTELSLYL